MALLLPPKVDQGGHSKLEYANDIVRQVPIVNPSHLQGPENGIFEALHWPLHFTRPI
jgi:hypothetical protein